VLGEAIGDAVGSLARGQRARQWRGVVAVLVGLLSLVGLSGCVGGPALSVSTAVSGLDHPWDVAFTPDGTMIYTERGGRISAFVGGQKRLLAAPADVVQASEAGMMGLAVDPQFASNRYIYACLASTLGGPQNDVRVARWRVNTGYTTLTNRTDIITGAPVNTLGELGRHSGCRPRFGPDGFLWIGTGDSAIGTVPQDLASLGGKVLRVDRNGAAAPGNLGGSSDPRIYSYGHRNVQGIAFRSTDGFGVSVEHGPDRDDELDALVKGNFGWDPVFPGGGSAYNEGVPMTDVNKFPSAISALWSSGSETVAPSGATFLSGSQWKDWNGALAIAELKGQRLLVLVLGSVGQLRDVGVGVTDQGRLRSPVQGPDGNLYVTTDNGAGSDKILKLVPQP
jgi:aldose sugar dehydrogenase